MPAAVATAVVTTHHGRHSCIDANAETVAKMRRVRQLQATAATTATPPTPAAAGMLQQ
jgi:hypothetical protein